MLPGILFAVFFAVAGLFLMWLSISKAKWAETFRAGWHYGRAPDARPVSRVGFFMMGLSWFLTGSFITALMILDPHDQLHLLPWIFILSFGPLIALLIIEIGRGGRGRGRGG